MNLGQSVVEASLFPSGAQIHTVKGAFPSIYFYDLNSFRFVKKIEYKEDNGNLILQVKFLPSGNKIFSTLYCQINIHDLKIEEKINFQYGQCQENSRSVRVSLNKNQKGFVTSDNLTVSRNFQFSDLVLKIFNTTLGGPYSGFYTDGDSSKSSLVKNSFAGYTVVASKFQRYISVNKKLSAIVTENYNGEILGKIPLEKADSENENVFINLSPDENQFLISTRSKQDSEFTPIIESKFVSNLYDVKTLKPIRTITKLEGIPVFSPDSKSLVASWYNPIEKRAYMRLVRIR